MITLSPQEKKLIDKLTAKELETLAQFSDNEPVLKILVKLMNLLSEDEKEWFFASNFTDEKELLKKHSSLIGLISGFKKFLRIIKGSEHELSLRRKKD